ncbi:MAG TPA: hypothetical protein VEK76_11520 [Candidatus Binatia bacterium]|nr:hypothetical protein [Candidatus Binatia bacterium]
MELRHETFTSEILDPAVDFEPRAGSVEVRWDPLTGYAARIVSTPRPLRPPSALDLTTLAADTQRGCPFCAGQIESATPRLPAAIHPEGRIQRGEAVLFPNLVTYFQHCAVCVYSASRHHLPLELMTPRLVADNLSAQAEYLGRVLQRDPGAAWTSINANHMLPSGSSVFHPHMQAAADPAPSTMQALLAGVPAERCRDYVDTERRLGARYIAGTGCVDWLASYAPMGFDEVRGFVAGPTCPSQLDAAQVEELGFGISRTLNLYAELGHQSFNMALYGAPAADRPGYVLSLRMVTRAHPQPHYRSDVMYSERMHWQAMVDELPETTAERARAHFGS